jgi:Nickel responsive protein SCO4226-like
MFESDQPKGYLVECYWPGVSEAKLAAAVERAQQAAAALRGQGRELRFLGSILVPADETVFCLFNGSEADVRTVSEESGVPYERILESLRIIGNHEAKEEK